MTVDDAIEQLQEIKKKDSKAGSYLIGDEDCEKVLYKFEISSYDDETGPGTIPFVAYELDVWVEG